MRHKWLLPCLAVLLAVTLLVSLGRPVRVNLAQDPQGVWLTLETEISPGDVSIGEGFLTNLVLRNDGTEPVTVDAVLAELPPGVTYVGQAVDSDVATAAEVGPAQLRWTGPFTLVAGAELGIRYWAVAGKQVTPGQYFLQATALMGEQSVTGAELPLNLLTEPASVPSMAQLSGIETAPALPSAVSVSKSATLGLVRVGNSLGYAVTFNNSGGTPVTLDTIADVLPCGFQYIGLAYGSQITTEPTDQEEPEIVWQGSFVVPAQGQLVLRYWVWVPQGGMYNSSVPCTNSVTAHHNTTTIGPAHADVMIEVYNAYLPMVFRDYTFPYFTAIKSANPASVALGEEVVYTVRLPNGGDDPGVVNTIEDTLPTGFTFLGMESGSEVTSPPSGTTGKITWSGPFTVAAHDDLKLIYRVKASTVPGTYLNSATATTLVGSPPAAPASVAVKVKPPILLQDNFDANANNWTPFVNNNRLDPDQWFWEPGVGLEGGAYNFSMFAVSGKEAHDALSMYLEEDSQTWTDYRYEAWVWLSDTTFRTSQLSLWFRGNYQESATVNQWVLGYYFNLYPLSNRVGFWQTQTPDDCIESTCWVSDWQYNYSNPMPLVEAPYAMGDPWLGKWHKIAVEVRGSAATGGVSMIGYVDDQPVIGFTDTTGTIIDKGTVGLAAYKAMLIRWDNILVTPLD